MKTKTEYKDLLQKTAYAMMHMENNSFAEKYPVGLIDMKLWEWPQGVGLYGLYQYYTQTKDAETLRFLKEWFDGHLAQSAPEHNVNTTCPLLTLAFLYEETGDDRYGDYCRQWADWVMHGLLRTGDGAFQHMITGDANEGQILIDTLFMTVLFLAKAGALFHRPDYIEEAKKQCLIHIKYLYDTSCGLYYHGFDFRGLHHYGRVHWARGNSWYTCGLVELLEMVPMENGIREYLLDTYRSQVRTLQECQNDSGMWHTILDDASSYEESSATAAFAYGILKGVRKGYLSEEYRACAEKAVGAVMRQIDSHGVVHGVSYGTPVGKDAQFYKDIPVCPMTYGQALTILMLTEAMRDIVVK